MYIMIKGLIIVVLLILVFTRNSFQRRPAKCGVIQKHDNDLIVLGHDTIEGEWPWHAAIYRRIFKTDSYSCGGTLITELFVLTAGHCVMGANRHQLAINQIFVRLGVHNLYELSSETFQQHSVGKIYQPTKDTTQDFRNDIALLELATVAKFNDYVQPACMSSTRDLTEQFGTVVGWGLTEDDTGSSTLKSVQMPVIDSMTCLASNRALFGATLDKGMFCAGYTNGTSVCNGDSGGGIFFNKDNVWYLGGIVSFAQVRNPGSKNCHTKGYAAFTKLYNYRDWILLVTKQQVLFGEGKLQTDDSENHTNLLPQDCGVYITNRIVRGVKADVFEFPWMTILRYNEEEKVRCAGTLINKRYTLTAAHCVKVEKPTKVILGEHNIGQYIDCNEVDGESKCAGT